MRYRELFKSAKRRFHPRPALGAIIARRALRLGFRVPFFAHGKNTAGIFDVALLRQH